MHKKLFRLTALCVWSACLIVARGEGPISPENLAASKNTIRLACIGDSITAGLKARGASFPDVLRKAMANQWEVTNLGVSGATMLRKSGASYSAKPQYVQALELKPNVVTIALGTNDSKPDIWKDKTDFEADYKAMIAELRKTNPKVIIYCCLPPPAFPGKWGINEATIKNEIIPLIRKVAEDTGCKVIDLYAALEGRKELVPDTVHPGADGHKLLAGAIFEAVTGKKLPDDALESAPVAGSAQSIEKTP